jgi:hypothetical protein|tara:strand:- start:278 stop:499 length:222 start_codon:yes stop_codon:yes gene_type:complete
MANNNENVLTFGDKSYSSEDLTEEQKYFASQIQELQEQRKLRHRALDQTTASIEFFTGRLIASLNQEDSSEVG